MRTGSAEARGHHKLRQDSGHGAGAEEHGAAGAVGRQKCPPVPEGDQPERSFPQDCRRKGVSVHAAGRRHTCYLSGQTLTFVVEFAIIG